MPTPVRPQTYTPLRAPSANVSGSTDPPRCTSAAAPQNYQWRPYGCVGVIPTHLRELPCARPPGLRCAPDSGENPPPSPSDGWYFPASAVPVLGSQSTRSEEHTSELQSLRHLVC